LDWDDAHKDFIAQEIATFIAHTFIEEKTIEIEKLKLYLNTYEKLLKLNREERKAIYFFIKHRFLSAITWHIDQLKKHRDRSRNIERFINRTIKKYRNFDKFPLGEFIRLFENVY
ncbi:hypothetical protein J7K74_00715, partial [Candidatus Woesearchaeota archaeon]|nr:hypothetical protein [Candidatus Woesearchaeota archaeon]